MDVVRLVPSNLKIILVKAVFSMSLEYVNVPEVVLPLLVISVIV